MVERVNVSLQDGVKEKLLSLAGGERKVGEYLSALIEATWARENSDPGQVAKQLDAMAGQISNLAVALAQVEQRLAELEQSKDHP